MGCTRATYCIPCSWYHDTLVALFCTPCSSISYLDYLPLCIDTVTSSTITSCHYSDIMGSMASQITSLTIVYSTIYSGADQRKHRGSTSLAFVWRFHQWPVNSPHKWPVMWKMFPFDDIMVHGQIMYNLKYILDTRHVVPIFFFYKGAVV